MTHPSRLYTLFCACLLLIFAITPAPPTQIVRAQTPPLRLPMASQPGVNTWLLGQPYGNTIGAFLRGDDWYRAGQRLHFGMDFAMPCGTPLVAVGDGEVLFVDDLGFGSAPHNLVLRLDAGYTALYGHLLNRAPLRPGARVAAGDLVGYSGDPDETCDSRPHLHLEIRSLDYQTAYNPAALIDANWHALAAIGGFSYPLFQQDITNARRWMHIDDQPDVRFFGAALNRYTLPYPDTRFGTPPLAAPPARAPLAFPTDAARRRLAYDGCCVGAWWDARDPDRLYTLDGGENARATIFSWNTGTSADLAFIGDAPPPVLSPDGGRAILPISAGEYLLRETDTGAERRISTGGSFPAFSTDNRLLMWTTTAPAVTLGAPPLTTVWVADGDGANARALVSISNGSAAWLDTHRLLLTERVGLLSRLSVIDVRTGESFTLGDPAGYTRIRGVSIAPGGGRVMFYTTHAPDPAESGVYAIATTPGAPSQRLPWFGAWRWRDADTVYYLPYAPARPLHALHAYSLIDGREAVLIDGATGFLVANGDWTVSADGRRIAFTDARDRTTWVIDVP